MGVNRLEQQLDFLMEIDRLKGVLRRSYILGGERLENSAEHSWHVALAAMVLAEHAPQDVDLPRIVCMLLVHDLVEIDAGDTFAYDETGRADQSERELKAAERLFHQLPADQRMTFHSLWHEFEAARSPEGLFANAIDRLLPVLHNLMVEGRSWREHGVTSEQVLERGIIAREGAPALWEEIQKVISESVQKGWLRSGKYAGTGDSGT
jgi:putative hydrolase of HD superfamily